MALSAFKMSFLAVYLFVVYKSSQQARKNLSIEPDALISGIVGTIKELPLDKVSNLLSDIPKDVAGRIQQKLEEKERLSKEENLLLIGLNNQETLYEIGIFLDP